MFLIHAVCWCSISIHQRMGHCPRTYQNTNRYSRYQTYRRCSGRAFLRQHPQPLTLQRHEHPLRRNLLYQATYNNVIALLEYRSGHWLIDADDGKRPNTNALTVMTAFKPSRDQKPDLRATATEAHHIWAHPGPDTIRHLQGAVKGFKLQGNDPTSPTTEPLRLLSIQHFTRRSHLSFQRLGFIETRCLNHQRDSRTSLVIPRPTCTGRPCRRRCVTV
jgi:hypothetical protein